MLALLILNRYMRYPTDDLSSLNLAEEKDLKLYVRQERLAMGEDVDHLLSSFNQDYTTHGTHGHSHTTWTTGISGVNSTSNPGISASLGYPGSGEDSLRTNQQFYENWLKE
jgi:hypothetical protein